MDIEVVKATLQRELDKLQENAPELWLQAALAEPDARRRLHRLDLRFRAVRDEVNRLGAPGYAVREDVLSNLRGLIDQLRRDYARVGSGYAEESPSDVMR